MESVKPTLRGRREREVFPEISSVAERAGSENVKLTLRGFLEDWALVVWWQGLVSVVCKCGVVSTAYALFLAVGWDSNFCTVY